MLTRDEIMSMQAGRELDALVAEHVMGWSWIADMLIPPPGDERNLWAAEWDEKGLPHWLPDYSTEIADAWQVVEKMLHDKDGKPNKFYLAHVVWSKKVFWSVTYGPGWSNLLEHVEADTPMLAICRAALMTTIR